ASVGTPGRTPCVSGFARSWSCSFPSVLVWTGLLTPLVLCCHCGVTFVIFESTRKTPPLAVSFSTTAPLLTRKTSCGLASPVLNGCTTAAAGDGVLPQSRTLVPFSPSAQAACTHPPTWTGAATVPEYPSLSVVSCP